MNWCQNSKDLLTRKLPILHKKVLSVNLSQHDDAKEICFATSFLLRFSEQESQKKTKIKDFKAFLIFSKQWWMDAPDWESF